MENLGVTLDVTTAPIATDVTKRAAGPSSDDAIIVPPTNPPKIVQRNLADRLKDLVAMRDAGDLTAEEFKRAKLQELGSPGTDGYPMAMLSNGEYRTVLAEQRTFLAFIRTALSVTGAYKDFWLGPVVGCFVLLIGTLQYASVAPLFLDTRSRVAAPEKKASKVNQFRLFYYAWRDSSLIGLSMVIIAAGSVIYKWYVNVDWSVEEAEALANATLG